MRGSEGTVDDAKEFKASFVNGYSKDGDDGEKVYDDTVLQCLHHLPILKKQRAGNGNDGKN